MTKYHVDFVNPIDPHFPMKKHFKGAYLKACAYARRMSKRFGRAYVVACDDFSAGIMGRILYLTGSRQGFEGQITGDDPLIKNWQAVVDDFHIDAVKMQTGSKIHGTEVGIDKTWCGQSIRRGAPTVIGNVIRGDLCKRCFKEAPIDAIQRELNIRVTKL